MNEKHITIKPMRRDGKFPIRISYKGAPNMFGGFYPPRVYNKLYTREKIGELALYSDDAVVNNSGQPNSYFWPEKGE